MKTNNDKIGNNVVWIVALFVVICCSVLYKGSLIDMAYLLIVGIYFSKYVLMKKKSISN